MRGLNMWHRLGIVATALWIVGGGLWQRSSDISRGMIAYQAAYNVCVKTAELAGKTPDFRGCFADGERMFQVMIANSWGNVAVFAIGIALLGWIFAYAAIWTARWVLAGRKPSAPK